jgi:hypothetical protein
MEDYEIVYDSFWKEIVENNDGSLNVDQVKKELFDFKNMMENVPKVFLHVTGGMISKPNTKADAVIQAFNEYVEDMIDVYTKDLEDMLDEATL